MYTRRSLFTWEKLLYITEYRFRFRIGFKYVFRWFPGIKMSAEEYRNSTLFEHRRRSRTGLSFSTTGPAASVPLIYKSTPNSTVRRSGKAKARKTSAPSASAQRRRHECHRTGTMMELTNNNNNNEGRAPTRRATAHFGLARPTRTPEKTTPELSQHEVESSAF